MPSPASCEYVIETPSILELFVVLAFLPRPLRATGMYEPITNQNLLESSPLAYSGLSGTSDSPL
jgi:hypothetical protein